MRGVRTAGRGGLRAAALACVLAAACATDVAPSGGDVAARDEVRAVPGEYRTIQRAVDAAGPGDLVLVGPGEYHEAIDVTTEDLVIRGTDRDTVVLDGRFELEHGVQVLETDGVAIENMTARNYTASGFYWVGADGFRGIYLTAVNNRGRGIWADSSVNGSITRSYASGSAVAGVAVGPCHPCTVLVDDVVAEHNGAGFAGANAGGELQVIRSRFRRNRIGIMAASVSAEGDPPQREATIVGNLVHANNATVDAGSPSVFAGGTGVLIAGGAGNAVERNRVVDHDAVGIGAVAVTAGDQGWPPTGNRIRGNVVRASGLADIAVADEDGAGNCVAGNVVTSSAPRDIQRLLPCAGAGSGIREGALPAAAVAPLGTDVEVPDGGDGPQPPGQPGMPAADTAPWEPAGAPPDVDHATLAVPPAP